MLLLERIASISNTLVGLTWCTCMWRVCTCRSHPFMQSLTNTLGSTDSDAEGSLGLRNFPRTFAAAQFTASTNQRGTQAYQTVSVRSCQVQINFLVIWVLHQRPPLINTNWFKACCEILLTCVCCLQCKLKNSCGFCCTYLRCLGTTHKLKIACVFRCVNVSRLLELHISTTVLMEQ